MLESLLSSLRLATLLKRDCTQVFLYKYCENFKNTYFKEDLVMAALEIKMNEIKIKIKIKN